MKTEKLIEAIQILIREEIKAQLPILLREVKLKKSQIDESNTKKINKKADSSIKYTKNSMINDILNETRIQQLDSDKTLNFNSSNVSDIAMRADLASKMGYGDFVNTTNTGVSGQAIDTNSDAVKNVMNAMNRDYSELVKRF